MYERPGIRTCQYATRQKSIGRPYLFCEGLPSSMTLPRSHHAHSISNHLCIMSSISLGEMSFIPTLLDHISTCSFFISIASSPTAICDNLPPDHPTLQRVYFFVTPALCFAAKSGIALNCLFHTVGTPIFILRTTRSRVWICNLSLAKLKYTYVL
jgi:hypothetical protein